MQVMIRCKVRPDGVEADLELLQEVYEEMRSVQPKGLRYATFQLEDKVTFVSFAEMDEALRCCSNWRPSSGSARPPASGSMNPPCSRCCTKSAPTAFTDVGRSSVPPLTINASFREGLRVQGNGDRQREGL